MRNTSGLKRGGSPGRPKGSFNAPKVKRARLPLPRGSVWRRRIRPCSSGSRVRGRCRKALEFVVKLTGELKLTGAEWERGQGGGDLRGRGPNALTPEVFRAAAAARLAQRAQDE